MFGRKKKKREIHYDFYTSYNRAAFGVAYDDEGFHMVVHIGDAAEQIELDDCQMEALATWIFEQLGKSPTISQTMIGSENSTQIIK